MGCKSAIRSGLGGMSVAPQAMQKGVKSCKGVLQRGQSVGNSPEAGLEDGSGMVYSVGDEFDRL